MVFDALGFLWERCKFISTILDPSPVKESRLCGVVTPPKTTPHTHPNSQSHPSSFRTGRFADMSKGHLSNDEVRDSTCRNSRATKIE